MQLKRGSFPHPVSESLHEIHLIKLEVDDLLNVDAATFFLTFTGRRSEPIPWDAVADDFNTRLQKLAPVGDISVSSTVD
jgi:hypothetical protein